MSDKSKTAVQLRRAFLPDEIDPLLAIIAIPFGFMMAYYFAVNNFPQMAGFVIPIAGPAFSLFTYNIFHFTTGRRWQKNE